MLKLVRFTYADGPTDLENPTYVWVNPESVASVEPSRIVNPHPRCILRLHDGTWWAVRGAQHSIALELVNPT